MVQINNKTEKKLKNKLHPKKKDSIDIVQQSARMQFLVAIFWCVYLNYGIFLILTCILKLLFSNADMISLSSHTPVNSDTLQIQK